ncbi:MAG: EAL domain-containing protein [Lachnospiraceae bacterium]|nr:EAL domain-containing protein [Lachnospiraceae bacterium]
MDFQAIVDGMSAMTCVVSVEKLPDGKPGKFRIVTGNKAYIDSIENPGPGTKMLTDKFVPNSEYTMYLTRDLNFEEYCYRSAVDKKCLHSYAHPDRMPVWFNMMFIPLWEDDGNLSYCLYMMEINLEADSETLSTTSSETASSVLDTCIRLRGTTDFKATMKDVIAGIRKLCDAEYCCILALNEFERSCSVVGEDFKEGSSLLPMETYVDDEFYDIAESWGATIAGSSCLIAKDEYDMEVVKERNPRWYDSLTSAGAKNIVLFPLKSRNQLLGYMWVLNFNKDRSIKIKETLEVTTFIVGSELGNYMLLDRLRLLSSKDLLTGVMNRNEMNNYVDSLCHGSGGDKSVGVIFADLNGLKAVNDTDGHNAGDLLLKSAANALRSVFDEQDIFRAGGDEFSIILTDITQEEVDSKIEMVRSACKKYTNLMFAIGGAVEKDSRNVRMALRRADEKMYEDKRLFYEKNPGLKDESRSARKVEDDVEEKFREQSFFSEMNYDYLTGLPSMAYFFKLADAGRKNMHENNVPSALVFINMNGLRYYNKRYGFAEGDFLIKELAEAITKQFGEDNCSRFGQDHFATFTPVEGLEQRLKNIFRDMKTANDGKTLPVRAGIYPDSMGIVETSLACDRAKFACDAARTEKGSNFTYFDEKMLAKELNRQYIVENIDRAISENWITAFYQPIVRATSRKVCDEEALARWIDPEKGMLSPADFIPILEDTKLIYKVDLHIVDVILERIKKQKKAKIPVVPISVNLSRTDFEACDIVEEITNRVDTSGVSRDLITIEITESVVGENFEFMKEQVERFQKLGFKVWMDDFGSGYSSLDLLQEMKFDLIKFDMRFMRQFEKNPKSRIILTELMRMAVSLGTETVCEGVETAEQVAFLGEIGCTKMQGYHFCKPIPAEEIFKRYKEKTNIGFEDPMESEYHRTLSSINLYDLGAVSSEEAESVKHYFNTLPMAIIESDGEAMRVLRCNKSYREFISSYFAEAEDRIKTEMTGFKDGPGQELLGGINRCETVGQRVFLSEVMEDGTSINAMLRKMAENQVNGRTAYAVAVLGITPKNEQSITYTEVAKALSTDYIDLYYVDLDTEEFTQYSPNTGGGSISVERKGRDFFATARKDALSRLHKDDAIAFVSAFTKENVIKHLDQNGAFTLTYRLMVGEEAQYVSLKIVRMEKDAGHIMMGVNNIDAQMKQQETLERLKEEQATYARIYALMGDFIAIYTVDPETGNYMQYSAAKEYSEMGSSTIGIDFFKDAIEESKGRMHPDDYDVFVTKFTKEEILKTVKKGKVYKIHYRLMIKGEPVKITLRAGLVEEKDGPQLIIGVNRSISDER